MQPVDMQTEKENRSECQSIPSCVHQYIFRLQIPIHDAMGMETSNGQCDLRRNELGLCCTEHPSLFQMTVQIATTIIIQYEIQFALRLKGEMQLQQKRVVNAFVSDRHQQKRESGK